MSPVNDGSVDRTYGDPTTSVNGNSNRASMDRDATLEKGLASSSASPETTASVSITFPEGGLQGWLTVLGGYVRVFSGLYSYV